MKLYTQGVYFRFACITILVLLMAGNAGADDLFGSFNDITFDGLQNDSGRDRHSFIPPIPVNLSQVNSSNRVNFSWQAGTGNITNSYNIQFNGAWYNGSNNTYYNTSLQEYSWGNISVYAYNSSGRGRLNTTPASLNYRSGTDGKIDIFACGILDNPGFEYTQISDINASSTCMIVNADNITYNGENKNIKYAENETGHGVFSDGRSNIILLNLNTSYGKNSTIFSHGVYLANGTNITIANGKIVAGNGYGIFLQGDSNCTVFNNTISSISNAAVILDRSHGNAFNDNTILSFSNTGFSLLRSNNNIIQNGSISSVTNYSYYLSGSGTGNAFVDISFNGSTIVLADNTSAFNSVSSGEGVWLNTTHQKSPSGMVVINRTILSFSRQNITWSDMVGEATALNFSISGLYPDTDYVIYNDSEIYSDTISDPNGNVLPVIINFTTSTRTMEVIQGGDILITYPVQYFTKQRYNDTHGNITVRGTYDGNPASIEARFNGSSWKVINNSPSNGTFYGVLTEQSVGQGNLEVRFSNNPAVTSSVRTIGIGDIFLVTGQSNSDCALDINNSYLNASNKYISTVYTHDDIWKKTEGSVCWSTGSTSGWFPLLSDYIIQNTGIPVSWIVTGIGNTDILNWQPGNIYFSSMQSQLNESTDNTGEVKAVLWYQGERDAPEGNYTYYLENLTNYVNGVIAVSTAKTVLVAQIGNVVLPQANRPNKDAVLRAQLTSWDTLANVSPGVLTYDVLLTEPDFIHFKTDEQIRTLDLRWWRVINNSLYGGTIGRSPRLRNATFIGNSTIMLTFDRNVFLSNNSHKAEGFYIQNRSLKLSDTNIRSSIINGKNITLYLNRSISNANITLGSLNDGVGKNVPRDIDMYPAETFFYVDIEKDITPPSSITSLGSTSTLNSINWSWNDPDDVDFSHVMVYINDILITNSSQPFYNFTGRNGSETWTISTRSVDYSGNINQTWQNHTARTDPLRDHLINGTVLGNGTGIAGAIVSADIFASRTDDAGFFSISVPEGTFNLTAACEPAFYPNTSVTITVGNETTVFQDIELFLKPAGNIDGSVAQS